MKRMNRNEIVAIVAGAVIVHLWIMSPRFVLSNGSKEGAVGAIIVVWLFCWMLINVIHQTWEESSEAS